MRRHFLTPRLAAIPVVALFLMIATDTRADAPSSAPASGISGQVLDSIGTPVKGATVKLFAAAAKRNKKGAAATAALDGSSSAIGLKAAASSKRQALQTATTDESGKFTFINVTPGSYSLTATSTDASGKKLNARQSITVTEGGTASVIISFKSGGKKKKNG